ncbi:putative dna-directed rna polymerase protein [Neofusicoccum parvum UCRNP2]|uniref:Putative dna-directed rna polymerase protein n=1 Tax=Botryosphaeria parva (strain UCR-NP2) TaxID=1287680 RepID=R1G6R9_BOTPV|nr:putative dna-directed rna polymerase protein [Neofusicoccum parvum UCRNP2]
MSACTVSRVAIIGALLASAANAHMIMAQPVPFGVSTLNNSPLGVDYPCKQRSGVYDITTMNHMKVGAPQTLSFTGTAIHGGGSCQLSVSLDKNPTAKSVFKVIHTIEGDCPGANAPETFQFKIPDGFPNGEFALAWTWFNKANPSQIGNREMYMNCAPITVTGGADNHDVYNKLPDMALANIPSTTCKTVDNSVPIIPNPGDSVVHRGAGPFEKMLGDCGGTPTTGGPSMGGGGSGGGESSPSKPVPGSFPETDPSPSPAPSFTTSIASSAPAAAPTQPPVDTPAPDGNGTAAGGACGADGTLVCNGPAHFGICSFGKVVWQPVAAGTQCKDGKIGFAKRDGVVRGIAGRVNYVDWNATAT